MNEFEEGSNMKLITKTTLKKWEACNDGYKRFCELFPEGADLQTASKRLIEDDHPEWSDWLWGKCANSDEDEYVQQCVVKAGRKGTAIAGDEGTAIAGWKGTAIAGDEGKSTAGDFGTAIAGWKGKSTAGDFGTAIAGWKGTAIAGVEGTAIAGDFGTVTAGDQGIIILKYWDKVEEKYKRKMSFVGDGGLKPNTPYKLDKNYKFVEVKK